MSQQKAGGSPLHYSSAYAPPIDPRSCPGGPVDCPLPGDDAMDGPYCDDSEQQRELENLQADMQRQVNNIKSSHLRWLPGRFKSARHQMLHVACVSGEDDLPKQNITAPLWPPVPRSRDMSKRRHCLDVHGHVIALKLWAKAVVFAVRYDKTMQRSQKRDLCCATEALTVQALHARKSLSWSDRWRLSAAKKQLKQARARI